MVVRVALGSNQKGSFHLGDVVENVRTVFEERNDVTVYTLSYFSTDTMCI